ncbi:pantoate--beta-alanine ligase [Calidifontibacillus erzurumensis]|uniref:Pantothenate synthetase n=1 Tax=Calidifontibacillus erzurumensis TaxID=2741433 RepID=A0A8J8K8S1_9BACI|nr:pantoate--beta-alanine ligase [Calidifontibacillus erzurumensis]NSL52266.1 pantoate--beta-alanine ligase [Calidifontibacillus erzurumensis]
MKIIRSIKEMQQTMKQLRSSGKTIGFVPTMGYLHEGHLKLMNEARKNNEIVVASIFVNPLQFGPNEDFESYPRDIERDEALAKQAGVDYIFYPDVKEMYPTELSTEVHVKKRVDVLCGKSRQGHFDGVATVLLKLFNIVMPDRAYFGLKDAQQVAVVDGLIKDYNIPVELVPVETVREEDGLAKSSRNVYLTEQERKEAPELYKSLQKAVEKITAGETDLEKIKSEIIDDITRKTSGKIDYVEIYSYPQLEPIAKPHGKMIIAIAVKFGKARLIDNVIFTV